MFITKIKGMKHVLLWQFLNAMTHLAEIRVPDHEMITCHFSQHVFPNAFFPKIVFPKAFFPMQDSQNILFPTFVFPNNWCSQQTDFPKLLFPIGNSPNVKDPSVKNSE